MIVELAYYLTPTLHEVRKDRMNTATQSPVIKGNEFYTQFDVETFEERSSPGYRTHFQQDRDRIVHTSAFRRMQAKTQIFKSGEYDFYRTRLTHSLEVAQIGRSICSYLRGNSKLTPTYHLDEDLIEACCLAHDIGHPPFGHAGETSLNRLMADCGGFEGNAQTLRLIGQTIFSEGSGRRGMSPTRAFADGVLKYKDTWATGKVNHFLYTDQACFLEFVAGEASSSAVAKTKQSIECQVMDWADDVAYCLGDLMDGVRSRFIGVQSVEEWASGESVSSESQELLDRICKALRERTLSRCLAVLYGELVEAVSLSDSNDKTMRSLTNRYSFNLDILPSAQDLVRTLKKLSRELVFSTAQVKQLEVKADNMLRQLFGTYEEHYWASTKPDKDTFRLLPSNAHVQVMQIPRADAESRARLICDHLSGMSDEFAVRTYRRMFDPDFGSLVDLI